MPNTIQGVLAARIDRLPDTIKRTLQAASVLGREFPLHLLQSICDRSDELMQNLTTLKHEEFLFERSASDGTIYVFKHALTQNVAYDSLLTATQQTLHEMAARALEQSGAARIEEHYEVLAHHYSHSTNVEKAIDYLELANLKAIRANAAVDAQIHFEIAIEIFSKLPDTLENRRRRIELVIQQMPVYLLQLKLAQYEALLRSHETMAHSVEDFGLLGRLYACIGHCEWFFGRSDDGIETERKAAALCEQAGEMGGATHPHVLVQWLHWQNGDCELVIALEDRTLRAHALAVQKNLRFYMWALTVSGWTLGIMGRFDEGLAKCRIGISAGESASDPSIVAQCRWIMAVIYTNQGALDKAVEYGQWAIDHGPTPADKAWAHIALAGALSRNSPEAAIQLLEPLNAFFRSAGMACALAWTSILLGESYGCAGRAADAIRTLEDAVELSHRAGMKHFGGVACRLIGEVAIAHQDPDALASSELHFARALALFEICGAEPDVARTYAGVGQLRLRQGKVTEARCSLNKALEISERLGMIGESERLHQIIERTKKR